MKITVDGFLLAGVWLGILLTLANDVVSSPCPRIVLAGMFAFAFLAAIGIAWRRYWKAQRQTLADRTEMRSHVKNYDRSNGE